MENHLHFQILNQENQCNERKFKEVLMSIDLSTFISTISSLNGFLPSNHFITTINPPSKLTSDSTTAQNLSILCEATQLPGIEIATQSRSMPYGFGLNYKMPIGVVFTDLDLRFIADGAGTIHKFFTDWLNLIVPFNVNGVTNTNGGNQPYFVSYYSDFVTNLTIQAMDVRANAVITYTLYNAYPVLLQDIQGDWGNQEQISRIAVKFNFTNWNVSYANITASESSSLSSIQGLVSQNNFGSMNTLISGINNPSPAFGGLLNSYSNLLPFLPTDTISY